ncbi:MAG: hypothetical protein JXA96_02485 [Sedimentisphaerales bacterium]|nr:hypothetical protein [Sedimentisphaerales bacterium]
MNRKKLLIIISFAILLVLVLQLTIFKPRNQGLYKVTILPTLGGNFTLPHAINDNGQVAGYSEVSQGNPHLFIWDNENGIRDLGPVIGDKISLNNAGQIAANMIDPNGNQRAFAWDPNNGRRILPTLGGNKSRALRINDKSRIVGSAETSTSVEHAFIWDDVNGIRDLTPNSTVNTRAWSINNSGQIIVFVPGGTLLVKVTKNNIMPPVPVPVRGLCTINDNGYVIGMVLKGQSKIDILTWHEKFGQKSLFLSDTGSSSLGPDFHINDSNQVIICEGQEYIGFLEKIIPRFHYKNYLVDPKIGTISLDGYVPINMHENLVLMDINNKGCIIGAIQSTKDSKSIGFLLEPIPENMEQMRKKINSQK